MSRIRTIKPEWRTDRRLQEAGIAARVLSVALITMADDDGRGLWREHVVAADVFGFESEPSRLLREAVASLSGWFVRLYEVRGETYFQIVHWRDHQKVDKYRASRLPEPPNDAPTPQKQQEDDESRGCREAVASESRGARESAAPLPRTMDHGPTTTDHGPTRARSPRKPDDRTPLDRARSALTTGYQRRYEQATGEAWMSAGQNGQAIRTVAAWCADVPDQAEARAEAVLRGMFADPWLGGADERGKHRRWPWGPVAKDPAKYADLVPIKAASQQAPTLSPEAAELARLDAAIDRAEQRGDFEELERLRAELRSMSERHRARGAA